MRAFVKQAKDRKTTRRAVDTECQVIEEAEFVLLGAEAVDISEDGMFVRSDAHPALGTEVFVSFQAPGTKDWIDVSATVARVVRGRRRSDGVEGLGLRFGLMTQGQRAVLSESLVGRPPPIPARHLRRDYAATIRSLGNS
jgi:Tfp pilus assembly protein PilZ